MTIKSKKDLGIIREYLATDYGKYLDNTPECDWSSKKLIDWFDAVEKVRAIEKGLKH